MTDAMRRIPLARPAVGESIKPESIAPFRKVR
jgi:hypothetical protein